MSNNNFVPVNEKLKRLIPDPVEIDAYNHFCTIIERMIINGHEAHKTIPNFDKCKPEIEAYKVFDGIQIPIHGYADLKGKMVIEDKCKFPRKGRVKKDGTRSWLTSKLPETPTSDHLLQTDFYHYATGLQIYICHINEETFKVFLIHHVSWFEKLCYVSSLVMPFTCQHHVVPHPSSWGC